jgi:hypothetical protein
MFSEDVTVADLLVTRTIDVMEHSNMYVNL